MHPILSGCSQVRARSRRGGTWDDSLNFSPCRFPAYIHSFHFWALPTLWRNSTHLGRQFYLSCYVLSHFSCVWLCATLWTVARQAPLSMGFSRQDYRSQLPCPPPGGLPDPGIGSPPLAGRFFTTSATWEVLRFLISTVKNNQWTHNTTWVSIYIPSPLQPFFWLNIHLCFSLLSQMNGS